MPSTSVATGIDDEAQIWGWHNARGRPTMSMTDDDIDRAREIRETLEGWGLKIWPSPAYVEGGLDLEALKKVNLSLAHNLAWGEQVEDWLDANAEPIVEPKTLAAIDETVQAAMHAPQPIKDDTGTTIGHELFTRVLWEKHRVLDGSPLWLRPKPGTVIPVYVRHYYGLVETGKRRGSLSGLRPPFGMSLDTIPRITPAFSLENGESVGRISSSQVSQAQYRACVAPKSDWGATAKGYPKLTFTVPSGQIDIQIKPEFPRGDTKEIKEMEAIRDELNVDDWEAMVMLQAQAMAERRPNGAAFIRDIDACDYQGLAKNVSGGKTSGHFSKNRKRFQDSMKRWAHLYVVTDTLQVSEIDGRGRKRQVVVEWREKALKINGNIARRDTDTILGWEYELGKTYTTFLTRPNSYIATLMQKAIELPGSYKSVKQLVHYLTIHFRANVKNGRGLERTMGEVLSGACLPANPTRQSRTIDATENTIRTAIEKGLIRLQTGERLWDADSVDLHTWTAVPVDLKGDRLFDAWKKQKVTFRAPASIEHEYDGYRKIKAEATP